MKKGKINKLLLASAVSSMLMASCGGGGSDWESSSLTNTTEQTPQTAETRTLKQTDIVGQVQPNDISPVVKLTVDTNQDGIFDTLDKTYQVIATDGKFRIPQVDVPENGTIAQLVVEAENYTTYTKTLNLLPDTPVNLSITLSPAYTKIVNLSRNRASGSKIIISLGQDGKLKVYRGTRAITAEVPPMEVELNEANIPENVTQLKVSMKPFNSSDPEDLKFFPGEFRGSSPDGKEEVGLESVAFAFLELKDQNGNPVSLQPSKADACLYRLTQTIPKEGISKIKEEGDFNKEEPGCQVPIYSFNENTGKWDFLGTGTLQGINSCDELNENGTYSVDICITKPNWGDYVNIDYPIYFTQVKEAKVCFVLKDNEGNPITNVWFEAYKDGFYFDNYTDENGITTINIATTDTSCEAITKELKDSYNIYYISPTVGSAIPVNLDEAKTIQIAGCDCAYEITENVSLTDAKVIVKDENGNPVPNLPVCLQSNDYSYYQCNNTNESGEADFRVIPNKTYTAFGPKLKSVEKTITNADNTLTLTIANNPPEIYVEVYSEKVRPEESVEVYVYAFDIDGDKLEIKNLSCGDNQINYQLIESEDGYLFASTTCTPTNTGTIEINCSISDGKVEEKGSASFEVTEENEPPIIYGTEIINSNGEPVNLEELKTSTPYTIFVYAYDPDGDEIQYKVYSNNCSLTNEGLITCEFDKAGNYDIIVGVSDGKSESKETISVKVYDENLPPQILGVYTDKYFVKPEDKIEIFVFAEDPDSQQLSAKFTVGESVQQLTCINLGSSYFRCSGEAIIPSALSGEVNFKVELSDRKNSVSSEGSLYVESNYEAGYGYEQETGYGSEPEADLEAKLKEFLTKNNGACVLFEMENEEPVTCKLVVNTDNPSQLMFTDCSDPEYNDDSWEQVYTEDGKLFVKDSEGAIAQITAVDLDNNTVYFITEDDNQTVEGQLSVVNACIASPQTGYETESETGYGYETETESGYGYETASDLESRLIEFLTANNGSCVSIEIFNETATCKLVVNSDNPSQFMLTDCSDPEYNDDSWEQVYIEDGKLFVKDSEGAVAQITNVDLDSGKVFFITEEDNQTIEGQLFVVDSCTTPSQTGYGYETAVDLESQFREFLTANNGSCVFIETYNPDKEETEMVTCKLVVNPDNPSQFMLTDCSNPEYNDDSWEQVYTEDGKLFVKDSEGAVAQITAVDLDENAVYFITEDDNQTVEGQLSVVNACITSSQTGYGYETESETTDESENDLETQFKKFLAVNNGLCVSFEFTNPESGETEPIDTCKLVVNPDNPSQFMFTDCLNPKNNSENNSSGWAEVYTYDGKVLIRDSEGEIFQITSVDLDNNVAYLLTEDGAILDMAGTPCTTK